MTEKQIPKLVAMLVEHQGCFAGLSTEDAQWVIQNTPDAIALMIKALSTRKSPEEISEETGLFLKKLTASGPLLIDAVDGSEILTDANDVFDYIDGDFKSWGADEKGVATEMAPVHVYEMVKDGTYKTLLGSLSSDFEKLCLTQSQIKNFVVNHRSWLRTDGYATFFAFKSRGKRFVALVFFGSAGRLRVFVGRFEDDRVWRAEDAHRFVIPQLAET